MLYLFLVLICVMRPCNVPRCVTARYKSSFYYYYYYYYYVRWSECRRRRLSSSVSRRSCSLRQPVRSWNPPTTVQHLTVESYTVFICQQSHLLLFGIPSPTHSHSRLKTFLFCKSFPPTAALPCFLLEYSLHGFPGLFTIISEHICFLLLVFLSVFTLFSCRFRAVD